MTNTFKQNNDEEKLTSFFCPHHMRTVSSECKSESKTKYTSMSSTKMLFIHHITGACGQLESYCCVVTRGVVIAALISEM